MNEHQKTDPNWLKRSHPGAQLNTPVNEQQTEKTAAKQITWHGHDFVEVSMQGSFRRRNFESRTFRVLSTTLRHFTWSVLCFTERRLCFLLSFSVLFFKPASSPPQDLAGRIQCFHVLLRRASSSVQPVIRGWIVFLHSLVFFSEFLDNVGLRFGPRVPDRVTSVNPLGVVTAEVRCDTSTKSKTMTLSSFLLLTLLVMSLRAFYKTLFSSGSE